MSAGSPAAPPWFGPASPSSSPSFLSSPSPSLAAISRPAGIHNRRKDIGPRKERKKERQKEKKKEKKEKKGSI